MRAALLVLALALVPALPAAARAGELAGPARVIDADTLEIAGLRVRLDGVDAPEMRQECTRDGRPWMAGRDATAWMRGAVAGRTVTCETSGRDRYGRAIGTCFVGGENLNKRLVAAGWARAYLRHSVRYAPAEIRARLAGRGIWRGACEAPWTWRHARR